MTQKFRCPHCSQGYQSIVRKAYIVHLPHSEVKIPNAEYFECGTCHERSLEEKLISQINKIEKIAAGKILLTVAKGGELDMKSVSFLRKVSGIRAVDLANKLKISKSTISNWDKKDSNLPYYLSILLCSLFARKLHLESIEKSLKENLNSMIAC